MSTPAARLLELLTLLHGRRDWPGAILAERLGVSARTVRRDVDQLRELGYRIAAVKGPDGGYRLEAGSELPPLLFDDEQAVALSVALQLATTAGAGIEEAALRALTTVRQVMPDRLRRRIDALRVTAVAPPGEREGSAIDSAVLVVLGRAVHDRERLRFAYASPGAEPDEPVLRRAEPHHLVVWGGRWYLVAWDLDRDDWRTFRADRITPRSPTGVRFRARDLPGGDLPAFVAARFRGSTDGSGAWPCRGSAVLARSPTEVATYAGGATVEALGPDRCRLHLGAWSWTALAAEFGRFDADLDEVAPGALAEACEMLARRYARATPNGSWPRPREGSAGGSDPGRRPVA